MPLSMAVDVSVGCRRTQLWRWALQRDRQTAGRCSRLGEKAPPVCMTSWPPSVTRTGPFEFVDHPPPLFDDGLPVDHLLYRTLN